MQILFNSEGRFAHQLSQFVHLLIISKKNNSLFFYRSFQSKYLKYFELTENSAVINDSAKLEFYYLCYLSLKMIGVKETNFNKTAFRLNLKQKDSELLLDDKIDSFLDYNKNHFIFDHALKDINSIIEYRSYIRSILKPKERFYKKAQAYINSIRKRHKYVLGLHIRRTDYAHFQGGRFYLKDEQLLSLLNSFHEKIEIDKSEVALIICSDEQIDVNRYSDFNVYYERRAFIDDFFILKLCDYIIGPHSIFSLMANYLGDNKICQITGHSKKELSMADFLESEQLLKQEYMDIKSVDER